MTRSAYSFANINLLGKCNLNCRFCLGKDLENEFNQYNHNQLHHSKFPRLAEFLDICRDKGIRQIYITGQNTDPLVYEHIADLIYTLKQKGFYVGVRSNGLVYRPELLNMCTTCKGDAVGLTILTLDPSTFKQLTGSNRMPNWDKLIKAITVPLRFSTVVTEENKFEILDLIKYVKRFPNVKYFQVRKVSTLTRLENPAIAQDRKVFDELEEKIDGAFPVIAEYEHARVYDIYGMPTSLWKTVETSANSINYFTSGVISDEYEIIRGYMRETHMEIPDDSKKVAGA